MSDTASPPDTHALFRQKFLLVLEKSQAMLVLAKEGEWRSLIALEEERRPILESLFNHSSSAAVDAGRLSVAIKQLMAIDQEITALSVAGREVAVSELRKLSKSRKAASLYAGQQYIPNPKNRNL